ncbi:unnamed protein product [Bursaphelenchus xylophilus]|uniref:(pine wood nematode) hypothetical protein n=1 Tax=Bursaphelenchus xylophilus TaxID=6326 RepID=A0A1I7SVE2_BURXY|nr:unnamed protein product [Bursaphelenchus xylophilus]CAG9101314.1 unnamed protein product [Bursaphelenchus xylophilus]
MNKMNWKKSASVILINKSLRHILMMKRGPTAKFMPNSMVFPGGILEDPYDLKFNKKLTNFAARTDANISVEEDLGFRICALRELFEEAGILLRENEVVTNKDDPKLDEWRTKVTKDPQLFSHLFTPQKPANVATLQPYARWLTPNAYKRRFDAVFYTVQLEDFNEKIYHCEKEMAESLWISPEDCIQKTAVEKSLSVPPPQFRTMISLQQHDITLPFDSTTYPERVCPQIVECTDDPTIRCGIIPPDSDFITDNSDFVGLRYMTKKEIVEPAGPKVSRIVYLTGPIMYTGQQVLQKGLE